MSDPTVIQPDRQASAQGMLGAAETLVGGITAVLAGVLYSWGGRELAFTTCSVVMIALSLGAWFLAGPEVRGRRGETGVAAEQDTFMSGLEGAYAPSNPDMKGC